MRINLHNKIEINNGEKTFTFFNTMLKSVRDKIKNLESYFDNVAFGTSTNNSPNTNFKLASHLKTFRLDTDIVQSNIANGDLYIKKYAIIDDSSIDGINLTEAGICSDFETNPTIYNYFSLINNESQTGIKKIAGKELTLSITIYLTLEAESAGLFTLGNNKFIEFLLGQGVTSKKVYAGRGKNASSNNLIYREKFESENLTECMFNVVENDDNFTLNFAADLAAGETHEIVFFLDGYPFARINTEGFHQTTIQELTYTSELNRIIDLGENVKSISNLECLDQTTEEASYCLSSYATSFGDKITLPFISLFDNNSPRFLSKDGDKIFFVSDDKIFGYQNINYSVVPLEIEYYSIQNITKIIAFGDKIFVISKSAPYVSAFVKLNQKYVNFSFNFEAENSESPFSDIFDIDITEGRNGTLFFGVISNETGAANVLYFSQDSQNKCFNFITKLSSEREYSYVLAMYKNNFSDSLISFIKVGENSIKTRIIYYFPDQTVNDIYSTIAWQITQNARELYVKSRAFVVEKDINPSIWVYFYPEWFKYTLSNSEEVEENNYISTNLKYLIKKFSDTSYKIYSLSKYNVLNEFENGFPEEVNFSKILDFEFLNDTLLIFTSSATEPIIAYNFFEINKIIENVDKSEMGYKINVEKYNILGKSNEGVTANFSVKINL